jgi:hypothetical protein
MDFGKAIKNVRRKVACIADRVDPEQHSQVSFGRSVRAGR